MKTFLHLIFAGLLAFSLSGCLVAESRYLQKVDEAEGLSKDLNSLQQKHAALTADNTALKGEFDKLKKDAAQLGKEKAELARDKGELEQVLKAKSDTLSQNISDLRQKVAALESENRKLKDGIAELQKEITALQKVKEEKVKEVSNTYEQLLLNMKSEIAKGQVTISELKGKLTVNMEAAILFDSGKAEVKDDGLEILLKMVETLKGVKDKAIRIEGHTDNVQIRGQLASRYPTNWELSAARAINVTRYLQQQGLDAAILSAAAFGEYKPVAANDTEEGRAKNRRIEITLVAKD